MRNNREAHVGEERGLVGKDTQVVIAASTRAELQLVDDAVARALTAPLLTDD
jgi:hypothetical protein